MMCITAVCCTFPRPRPGRDASFHSAQSRTIYRIESPVYCSRTPRARAFHILLFDICKHTFHHCSTVSLVPVFLKGMKADQLSIARHVCVPRNAPPSDAVRLAIQFHKVTVPEPFIQNPTIDCGSRFQRGTFCKDICGNDLPECCLPAFRLHIGKTIFVARPHISDLLHRYPPKNVICF